MDAGLVLAYRSNLKLQFAPSTPSLSFSSRSQWPHGHNNLLTLQASHQVGYEVIALANRMIVGLTASV